MSAVILVVSIVFFVSMSCAALSYMLFPKEQTSSALIPQVPDITETDHTSVPFSYNVPVDSHMNYKNDVIIVVEHPDEHVTIGMAPR